MTESLELRTNLQILVFLFHIRNMSENDKKEPDPADAAEKFAAEVWKRVASIRDQVAVECMRGNTNPMHFSEARALKQIYARRIYARLYPRLGSKGDPQP